MARKPTREEVAKIAANYKELRQKVGRAGTLVLQMIAHPDATEAQLLEVAYSYRKAFILLREVHNDCNTKIGSSHSMFHPHPWETPLQKDNHVHQHQQSNPRSQHLSARHRRP